MPQWNISKYKLYNWNQTIFVGNDDTQSKSNCYPIHLMGKTWFTKMMSDPWFSLHWSPIILVPSLISPYPFNVRFRMAGKECAAKGLLWIEPRLGCRVSRELPGDTLDWFSSTLLFWPNLPTSTQFFLYYTWSCHIKCLLISWSIYVSVGTSTLHYTTFLISSPKWILHLVNTHYHTLRCPGRACND